jgi:hypothetical protein
LEPLTLGHRYTIKDSQGAATCHAHRPSYALRNFIAVAAAVIVGIGIPASVLFVSDEWAKAHESIFNVLGFGALLLGPTAGPFLAYSLLRALPRVTLYHDEGRSQPMATVSAAKRIVFRAQRFEVHDAGGALLAVVTRGAQGLGVAARVWRCFDPGGRLRFEVVEGGDDTGARQKQIATVVGANIVGIGLLLLTGRGFTAHRDKVPLTFQYYAPGGDRSLGTLDRSTEHKTRLRLKPEFGRFGDARLGLAVALLVDVEEPAKA